MKITSSDLFSNVMDVAVKYRLWLYKLPRCVSYGLFGNLKPTPRLVVVYALYGEIFIVEQHCIVDNVGTTQRRHLRTTLEQQFPPPVRQNIVIVFVCVFRGRVDQEKYTWTMAAFPHTINAYRIRQLNSIGKVSSCYSYP